MALGNRFVDAGLLEHCVQEHCFKVCGRRRGGVGPRPLRDAHPHQMGRALPKPQAPSEACGSGRCAGTGGGPVGGSGGASVRGDEYWRPKASDFAGRVTLPKSCEFQPKLANLVDNKNLF